MEQRSTANSKQGAIDLSSEFPLGRSLIDAGSEMLPAYFFFFRPCTHTDKICETMEHIQGGFFFMLSSTSLPACLF